ncbi:glycosyltransferase [Myxococcaceae bacterium GXIMD 01537]
MSGAPLRVLHVYSGNLYGGIESLLVTLARLRALAPMAPEYALCFEGRLSRELRAEGVPVHALGEVQVRRPWTVWRARRRLAGLLRRERYDAIVCHAAWAQALFGPMAVLAGVPHAFFLHDVATGQHWLERWAAVTRPAGALCNSHFTAGSLSKLYPGVASRVVYLPVAAREPSQGARERLRTELGASPETCVILQASRMQSWKGQALHLRALGRLRDRGDWQCWLAGGAQRPEEEAYVASLRRLAEEEGIAERVRFLGQRQDVPDLLAAADVFCQPNEGPEPFGIALVEALGAGRPVVTTRMGAAPEVLDAACGVLVEPRPEALAGVLERLVSDAGERERLGREGPARARHLCEPGARLKELAAGLEALARPGAAREEAR